MKNSLLEREYEYPLSDSYGEGNKNIININWNYCVLYFI